MNGSFCYISCMLQIGGRKNERNHINNQTRKAGSIKSILDEKNCGGMTISTVMGCGTQKGTVEGVNEIKGFKTTINLLPKVRVEVVVEDSKVEQIILDVREKVATGHVGDGKIFIRNIEEAIRIRTGERGEKAL